MAKGRYDALDIASYIVNTCIDNGKPVNNLKLQKILYYTQAAFLVKDMEPFDNQISAWKYGPVVEDVYYFFKKYSNTPIEEKVYCEDFKELDEQTKKIVDEVVDAKINYDAYELVQQTHEEAPWINARNIEAEYITQADIKQYFTENDENIKRIYQ